MSVKPKKSEKRLRKDVMKEYQIRSSLKNILYHFKNLKILVINTKTTTYFVKLSTHIRILNAIYKFFITYLQTHRYATFITLTIPITILQSRK